jgi:hypothetical protein
MLSPTGRHGSLDLTGFLRLCTTYTELGHDLRWGIFDVHQGIDDVQEGTHEVRWSIQDVRRADWSGTSR